MASMVIEAGVGVPVFVHAAVVRVVRAAVVEAFDTTCDCGQALECSHTEHCPRCGITLIA